MMSTSQMPAESVTTEQLLFLEVGASLLVCATKEQFGAVAFASRLCNSAYYSLQSVFGLLC
jgi:hypothetical protein